MIQCCSNRLFAVKTRRILRQNFFTYFFVIRIIFAAFQRFHKKFSFFSNYFALFGERENADGGVFCQRA
jgi:hypothetical protein